MRSFGKVGAVLIGLAILSNEASSFRSGATVKSIEQELASWGIVNPTRASQSPGVGRYVINTGDRWFSFCQDKLFEYDRAAGATLAEFSIIIESEITRRGQPTANVEPVSSSEKGLWFRWLSGDQAFTIIFGRTIDGTTEVTKRYTDDSINRPCH